MLPRDTEAVESDAAGVAALALSWLPSRVAVTQEDAPTTPTRARTPTTRHGRRRRRPSSPSTSSGGAACCCGTASVSRLISYHSPCWYQRLARRLILAVAGASGRPTVPR